MFTTPSPSLESFAREYQGSHLAHGSLFMEKGRLRGDWSVVENTEALGSHMQMHLVTPAKLWGPDLRAQLHSRSTIFAQLLTPPSTSGSSIPRPTVISSSTAADVNARNVSPLPRSVPPNSPPPLPNTRHPTISSRPNRLAYPTHWRSSRTYTTDFPPRAPRGWREHEECDCSGDGERRVERVESGGWRVSVEG